MDQVPITFEHKGKQYAGEFHAVAGAGSTKVWHLMIDKYYYGRLRQSDGWFFDSTPKLDLTYLTDFFGDYIVAWYQ